MSSTIDRNSIITLPHADLRTRSKRVAIITDEVLQLVEDMKSATLDWEANRPHEVGVALAAVQIDALSRVVIVREDFNDRGNHNFTVLINPELTKTEGVVEEDYEGCLSVRDLYGLVPRWSKVRVRALDINGEEIKLKAEGFLARVLQHEIDHTNGKLFVDHIRDSHDSFFMLDAEGKLQPVEYSKIPNGTFDD